MSLPKKLHKGDRMLLTISSAVMGLISFGAVFYHYVEDLKWMDAFYFSVITLTTVGYGDISPKTDTGKVFTMIYVLVGVGILMAYVNAFGERRARKKVAKRKERLKEDD